MKRITSLLLALIMAAALLAGCGETENTTDVESKTGEENTVVSNSSSDTEANTNSVPTENPAANLSGMVATGGSTSVSAVMEALIFQFEEYNDKVTVKREENGSGDGINKAKDGTYEIGHSSRELKTDGSEDGLIEIPYAIDGIAVVLHKDNEVKSLTKQQLFDIYTGVIDNWKDVGGKDELIAVVTREDGSGTRAAFAEIVGLEKKKDGAIDPATAIKAAAAEQNSSGNIKTAVSGNPAAIGYMSYSDADDPNVKLADYEGVAISNETLKDGSYKLMRQFYMVVKEGRELSAAAQAFIGFVLSAEGQQIVESKKLLSVD